MAAEIHHWPFLWIGQGKHIMAGGFIFDIKSFHFNPIVIVDEFMIGG
jgi:hypothetical protein